ncbi:MAG: hypothetical protein LQ341_006747 [Variospora aurantia]|nr:MAG: hypothetical protein LQ341_006747 [Variospora aurantia]
MYSTDRQLNVVNSIRSTNPDFEIVVSHYNEDLSWLKSHSSECCVYSKGGPKNAPNPPLAFTPLPNIGREGHTFLYHIANQYDKLAGVTLFVQGRIDDHVDLTLDEMKKQAMGVPVGQVRTYPFRELEVFDHWDGIPWEQYPCWKRWSSMDTQSMGATPLQLFQQYITEDNRIPVAVGFAPGAIFAVKKETIHQHSRAYYQRLLERMFLGNMAHVNPETGHYMERFWLAVFNPEEYVQWTPADLSEKERNKDGQLAKGSTNANEAVNISFVQPGQSSPTTLSTFHPKFTYPIFGEEECIFGYQGLEINLRFAAHDLRPNVSVKYDKKFKTVNDTEALDIEETLKEWMPEASKTDPAKASFQDPATYDAQIQGDAAAKDWKPPGELINSYTSRGRNFQIWSCELTNPAAQQLIDRIQILVSFFIEGGTPIPLDDQDWSLARWKVFLVYATLDLRIAKQC